MNVVVVESPTKASTIGRYLGPDYKVVASYGHVRDLLPKDGSVRPDDAFAMDWTVADGAEKHIGAIRKALRGANHLYLATDPDREGEAISWHVRDELGRRGLLDGVAVKRVVFTEVTKSAVLDAMAAPRDLDDNLIDAYRARRALDYLVGFTLSPVLWRKLPGSRSAGRVQSVALRLICARELEIEAFKPREYWSIEVDLDTPRGERMVARLAALDGEKLGKYALGDQAAAEQAAELVRAGRYRIAAVEPKRVKRNPAPPFTTSTLQQEASRKLGFAARRTMQVAQQLYEGIAVNGEQVGLITYMRTDGVQIAEQALRQARDVIGQRYGSNYVPEKPRRYRTKAKNAQEAHEAIRPTDLARTPQSLSAVLKKDQARLYELIWKRALASQMASAEIDRVSVDIASDDGRTGLRATGQTVAFDGFLRVYQEGRDDARREGGDDADDERRLPAVTVGEAMAVAGVTPNKHVTEPPPRFSEASLVRRLEELGIGRPSTYASIISVLQDRNYVRLEKRRFVPEDRGRIVTGVPRKLLQPLRRIRLHGLARRPARYHLRRRNRLAGGAERFLAGLRGRGRGDQGAPGQARARRPRRDARSAPLPRRGRRRGPPLPLLRGRAPRAQARALRPLRRLRQLSRVQVHAPARRQRRRCGGAPRAGERPETGLPIQLKRGPYGLYVERGVDGTTKEKPKRVSLPQDLAPDLVDLQTALGLLSLPREIGTHPETGKPVTAGIGRFGAYVKHDGAYRSLPRGENVLDVGLNRAVVLIAEKKGGARLLRELGAHPDGGQAVTLHTGRYGPYVQHGRLRASLPKGASDDNLTLDEAVKLLAAKAAKGGAKKKSAGRGRKSATAKTGTARSKSKRGSRRQADAPADGAP